MDPCPPQTLMGTLAGPAPERRTRGLGNDRAPEPLRLLPRVSGGDSGPSALPGRQRTGSPSGSNRPIARGWRRAHGPGARRGAWCMERVASEHPFSDRPSFSPIPGNREGLEGRGIKLGRFHAFRSVPPPKLLGRRPSEGSHRSRTLRRTSGPECRSTGDALGVLRFIAPRGARSIRLTLVPQHHESVAFLEGSYQSVRPSPPAEPI